MKVRNNWPHAVALRIGLGGEMQFTNTRCGATLHIPCHGRGRHRPHVVDVHVGPGQHPDAVAKKMIRAGWTIGGHRLMCPDTRAKSKERNPKMKPNMGPGMASASDIALAATLPPLAPPEEKEPVMAEATAAPVQPAPTPAAGRAKRLVYMALEEDYDEMKRAYKPGKSDATIAKECGVSDQLVKTIREESYGPLAEPNEVKGLRDVLTAATISLNETTERCVREVRAAATTYCKTVEDIDRRLTALARKNNWAE